MARFHKFPKSKSWLLSWSFGVDDVVLHVLEVGLVFGGLICKDKSGWAGKSSISLTKMVTERPSLFLLQ